MAAVQQRVLNWLYSVLTSEYKDVNRTYNDVGQTLSYCPSLTPRTEVFTYENGTSALLLQLSGTLPVTFRNTIYRFPLSVWIPHDYPNQAPIVYVTPTAGIVVRAGQHVDPQGKVYHPYLAGWPDYPEKSNVVGLLKVLQEIFAKEPPVVAQTQRSTSAASSHPTSQSPPAPPVPAKPGRESSRGNASMSGNVSPGPTPPPKPYDDRPQRTFSGSVPHGSDGPPLPPLPPHQSQLSGQRTQDSHGSNGLQNQPSRQSSLRYANPPPLPTLQPVYPLSQQAAYTQSPSGQYQRHDHSTFRQQPSYNHSQSYHYTADESGVSTGVSSTSSSLNTQRHNQMPQAQGYSSQPSVARQAPPADLLDSDLMLPSAARSGPLPVPPVPPNPEKDMLFRTLARALQDQRQKSVTQTVSSLPGLQAQHTAMLSSLSTMQAELSSLTLLSQTLTSNTNALHKALADADQTISDSRHREPPKVDEILVAPTVVGNQLYDLVGEERALGDALFILGRAVERGRISAPVFVKTTRSLAREWFLKKAIVAKIGQGMGLDAKSATTYGR